MIVVTGSSQEQVAKVRNFLAANPGRRVGVLATSENLPAYRDIQPPPFYLAALGSRFRPERSPAGYSPPFGRDEREVEVLLVEAVAPEGMGMAVMNRLSRASAQHEI